MKPHEIQLKKLTSFSEEFENFSTIQNQALRTPILLFLKALDFHRQPFGLKINPPWCVVPTQSPYDANNDHSSVSHLERRGCSPCEAGSRSMATESGRFGKS
ncbi:MULTISPECIES: hypothetical protein [Vibrio]|uniref:Uncharacterized protein n=1 Tax=Vibrio parahaemolyticus TaxID=670 RepID=A0AA47L9J7_VIBPH|nr:MULTISPECIES: hypothetical protein [Vibrio]MBE4468330.1 hypothetical protein [Vibrio parahaemolyticus]MBN8146498.1 hypothetical protein [Vibrio vulnificus]MDF4257169.1 hypothetical protein [Vibrio parahaemolyticus]MDF4262350.1 hypothetical protein [Vibrio parahaemolyticus]MDF4324248.1 hypothetical protein [Vibrio parahaemolyticus]